MKPAETTKSAMLISKTTRRLSFTLIELLITIAVISLLASMLAPSLREARNRAKDIKCASNIRQIYLATMIYVNDHEGRYPVFTPAGIPSANHMYQYRQIELFSNVISTPEVYRCPFRNESNNLSGAWGNHIYPSTFNGKSAWTEYKMNDDDYQLMTNTLLWAHSQLRPNMVVLITDVKDWEPKHRNNTAATFCFGDGRIEMLPQSVYWGPEPGRSAPWNWFRWGMYDI